MNTRTRIGAAALVAALGAVACSEITFEGGGPITLTLTADRTTAAKGQDVTFTYDVTGELIEGVTLDFGDGDVDTTFTLSAQSASGRFVHAYSAAGTFTAVGVAHDSRQGPDSARVVIQVTGS